MALFKRRIEIEAEEEGGGLRMKGALRDERLGEELHAIEAEMLVSVWDGEIKEISGSMPAIPRPECREGLASLDELPGVKIRPGFTDTVKNTVGSNRGCTHLACLIMNMGNVSVQGRGAFMRKYLTEREDLDSAMETSAQDLGLIDSCVCWREDGPILKAIRHGRGSPSPRSSPPGGEEKLRE